MAISLVASNSATGAGANALVLSSIEGNLQVVFFGHRTSSLTPSIDGAGWSAPYLIESEIVSSTARRAEVMYWRVVPAAQSATINVDFSASTNKASVGYEFATDTAGGTWNFQDTEGVGKNNRDTLAVPTTSLFSGDVTPQFAEAFAIDSVITRHGLPADEDTYSDLFIVGPSNASGTSANSIACFSGYKIVNTTPAIMSTTASWTTDAMATSIIGVWSVDPGGPPVNNVTASIPINIDMGAQTNVVHNASGSIPLTLDVGAMTATPAEAALVAAQLTLAAQPLQPIPLAVAVDLAPAEMTLTAIALDPQPVAVSVAVGPASFAFGAQALQPSPGLASLSLAPATLTFTPQELFPLATGEATVVPATLTFTPQPLVPQSGLVDVDLVSATLTFTPQELAPAASGEATIVPATLTLVPQALTPQPGLVNVDLAPATFTFVPQTMEPIQSGEVNLVAALMTLTPMPVAPIESSEVDLVSATLTFFPQPLLEGGAGPPTGEYTLVGIDQGHTLVGIDRHHTLVAHGPIAAL